MWQQSKETTWFDFDLTDLGIDNMIVQYHLFSSDPNSVQVTSGGCSVVSEMTLQQF